MKCLPIDGRFSNALDVSCSPHLFDLLDPDFHAGLDLFCGLRAVGRRHVVWRTFQHTEVKRVALFKGDLEANGDKQQRSKHSLVFVCSWVFVCTAVLMCVLSQLFTCVLAVTNAFKCSYIYPFIPFLTHFPSLNYYCEIFAGVKHYVYFFHCVASSNTQTQPVFLDGLLGRSNKKITKLHFFQCPQMCVKQD